MHYVSAKFYPKFSVLPFEDIILFHFTKKFPPTAIRLPGKRIMPYCVIYYMRNTVLHYEEEKLDLFRLDTATCSTVKNFSNNSMKNSRDSENYTLQLFVYIQLRAASSKKDILTSQYFVISVLYHTICVPNSTVRKCSADANEH